MNVTGSSKFSVPRGRWRKRAAEYSGMLVALGLLVLVFSLSTKHFFSPVTFRTIANQIPALLLVATGMTWILVLGEIDLSVGSVFGFCTSLLGVALVKWHWPVALALMLAVVGGVACGSFNGWVSQRWKLPTFIVTLGMLEMARGGAHFVTSSQTQYVGSKIEWISGTAVAGLSLPFLLALVVVAAAEIAMNRTVFGRYVVATGTNAEAVRLTGIEPGPIKLAVFVASEVLVSLAAIVDTSRFQSANPNSGTGLELQAIAAAVIGGTSLMGGRGSVLNTLFGVLVMAVLNAGLAAIGARDETKRLVTGLVIVGAVIVDRYRTKPGRSSS